MHGPLLACAHNSVFIRAWMPLVKNYMERYVYIVYAVTWQAETVRMINNLHKLCILVTIIC
jgi:hypothetical protein